ncbi:unnamed protein product [Arabis nemorensis]|uniref:Uncharacterized protein n=1 Tax=Arabis nemorensis TaxID=586526 RepID=A0A565AWI0_9BRAS|nr:unnamed protein product [Arabis nemorensis]
MGEVLKQDIFKAQRDWRNLIIRLIDSSFIGLVVLDTETVHNEEEPKETHNSNDEGEDRRNERDENVNRGYAKEMTGLPNKVGTERLVSSEHCFLYEKDEIDEAEGQEAKDCGITNLSLCWGALE